MFTQKFLNDPAPRINAEAFGHGSCDMLEDNLRFGLGTELLDQFLPPEVHHCPLMPLGLRVDIKLCRTVGPPLADLTLDGIVEARFSAILIDVIRFGIIYHV